MGPSKCGAQKGGEPRRVGSPEGWRAQNFALFFPCSCHNFLFSFSLKRRNPEMCTFGVLDISGFRPSKTPTKFNERTPRERKKNENCGGRREKKSEILGCPAEGCPAEGCPAEGSIGNGVQGSWFRVQFRFLGTNRNRAKTK